MSVDPECELCGLRLSEHRDKGPGKRALGVCQNLKSNFRKWSPTAVDRSPPKPTKEEIEAQQARLDRRRKLRLELLELADQESVAAYLPDAAAREGEEGRAAKLARHRVEHCELAIRIYELEYPRPPEPRFPGLEQDGAAVPD